MRSSTAPKGEGSNLDDDPMAVAEAEGLEVVLPEDNQLFVDIDGSPKRQKELIEWCHKMLSVVENNGVGVAGYRETTSKSGGTHAYIELDRPIDPMTRIALQACLGSDRKRELLSVLRVLLKTGRPPTIFFEVPKDKDYEPPTQIDYEL